eukprot:283310-Chlamydomonas_euryale.AAC.1
MSGAVCSPHPTPTASPGGPVWVVRPWSCRVHMSSRHAIRLACKRMGCAPTGQLPQSPASVRCPQHPRCLHHACMQQPR